MPYEKRGNKFCSSSCSASFTNIGKIKSRETKDKIGKSISDLPKKEKITYLRICKCEKSFETLKDKQIYCSRLCARKYNGTSEQSRKIISDKAKERIKAGTFSGWKSRKDKIPSYPEKYFISLFEKDNIEGWERDKRVGRWFIDFAFDEKMIALEIDGKQHQDRREKDREKDEYLRSQGWNVVRIDWFNPVNETNKEKLYLQIDRFKTMLKI
jgi:very-short-patch-repair endonuclease